jgi:hypothetical protein
MLLYYEYIIKENYRNRNFVFLEDNHTSEQDHILGGYFVVMVSSIRASALVIVLTINKLNSMANYTDRATAACRRS